MVAGAGAGLLGSVAQTVMLSRWFPTARGAVNGIALSGMGLGIFLFAPLSAFLIARSRLALGVRGARRGSRAPAPADRGPDPAAPSRAVAGADERDRSPTRARPLALDR